MSLGQRPRDYARTRASAERAIHPCPSGNDTAANSLPGEHARRAEEKILENGSRPLARDYRRFYWQRGYGAFSVSPSQLDALLRYVETLEEHYRSRTFQQEYREFLRNHDVKYDERYMWD